MGFRELGEGNLWHADDLHAAVAAAIGRCSPESANRVLRALRDDGVIDYEVVNRAASFYRLTRAPSDPIAGVPVAPPPRVIDAPAIGSLLPARVRAASPVAVSDSADAGRQLDFADHLERARA